MPDMSHSMEDLLARLNAQQRAAVEAEPGPMLILAGAGSGKTRVLTHRIAYLIHHRKIRPWDILAVTFTNKAAEEMGIRVNRLLEGQADAVTVSTFHSLSARILRMHIDRLGYEQSYVIYDDTDQVTLLKRVLDDLKMPRTGFDPRLFRTLIDRAKNNLQWPDQVDTTAAGAAARLAEVYGLYQRRLKASNALDFGDLLLLTVKLLEEHEDVRRFYHERYKHLLIDEYQDTNRAQYRMAQLLTNPHTRSICVVGDEDQSIYAFRGADISNILNFSKDFPDAQVIKLEQNYRSTHVILKAAGAVVANNRGRIGKTLWTDRSEGELIHYMEVDTDVEEASRVAEEIRRLRGTHAIPYGDMAVFYRANSQSRLFEEVFNYQQVPYHLVGQGFYDRKEIKDMRAYLQLIFNPLDDASLERVLNEPPRGIGDRTRTYLFATASVNETPCYAQLVRMAYEPGTHAPHSTKLLPFYNLLEKLRTAARTLRLRELLERVLEDTGYRDRLVQAGDIESEGRLENLRELMNVAAEFDDTPGMEGLQRFLERVSLRSQSDERTDDAGLVTLMTLHNAKGLEFPVVFLVGLEDGLFPHSRTLNSEEELEEERRLCYVGLTRAMNRLYLVRARRRRFQGEMMQARPSRFLKEVPPELMVGKRGAGVAAIARRYGMGDDGDGGSSGYGSRGGMAGARNPGHSSPGHSSPGHSSPGHSSPGHSSPGHSNPGSSGPSIRQWLGEGSRTAGVLAPQAPGEPHVEYDEPVITRPTIRSSGDDSGPFQELQVGRRVTHPSFGEGMIKGREGPSDNPRLTIQFKTVGNKKLMARYAALELLFR